MNIIVAIDEYNGIGKEGSIPWTCPDDLRYFAEVTAGATVIMGRITYESIGRPLEGRQEIVVSSTAHPDTSSNKPLFAKDIHDAVSKATNTPIFFIGGEDIYVTALSDFNIDKVYVTEINGTYDCDRHFPYRQVQKRPHRVIKETEEATWKVYCDTPHEEYQYLDIIKELLAEEPRDNRTAVQTRSLFGKKMKFDLRGGTLPLFTTRKTGPKSAFKELMWMLGGGTNSKDLESQGVYFWSGNSAPEFREKIGLNHYPEGELGPIYGFQWRHWGGDYVGLKCSGDLGSFINSNGEQIWLDGAQDSADAYEGIDQLVALIGDLKNNPHSRRLILSAWNVGQLSEMVLPPCHCFAQFYVTNDDELCCQMYQRSADMIIGVPYNVCFYSMLTHILAKICGYTAGELHHVIGDAHVYESHINEELDEMLSREPLPFPTIEIIGETLEDITMEVNGYRHCGALRSFEMVA